MNDIQSVKAKKWHPLIAHHRKTLLIIGLLIISLVATGFVYARKQVSIVFDNNTIQLATIHVDPLDVLAQAGVTLGPNDEYRLSGNRLVNGTKIEVFRAVQVAVTYQGETKSRLTAKPTIREFLDSMGIPTSGVLISPDANHRPQSGMRIHVVTLREEQVKEKRRVPYTIIRKPDNTLEKGLEEAEQAGKDGVSLFTVNVQYHDGIAAVKTDIAEKVIETSTPKVVRVGTRDMINTSRGAIRFKSVRWMEATAYHPMDGTGDGITFSGVVARRGVVAVDPDVIPIGTKVYVPGYGLASAEDTGGDIQGERIDLCMEDYDDAWAFGRRMIKVYILEH